MLIFTRNAAGELVSEENHSGKFEYAYDAFGILCSARFPGGRELPALRTGPGICWRYICATVGRRTRWRHTVVTLCTGKPPAARACSRRKPTTTPWARHPAHGAESRAQTGVRTSLPVGPHRSDSPADTHRCHARHTGR